MMVLMKVFLVSDFPEVTKKIACAINTNALGLLFFILPQTMIQGDGAIALKLIEHLHDLCSKNDTLYIGYKTNGLFESLAMTAFNLAKFGVGKFGKPRTRQIFSVS